MMSNIKNKKRKNDDNEQSEHFQNAEFVTRQESDVIIEKTIQSETKDDNEKNSDHEFSENDAVDYAALVEKKRARNKNLKVKKEYQILLKKIKDCKLLFEKMKFRRRQDANATSLQRAMILQMKFLNSNVSVQSPNWSQRT